MTTKRLLNDQNFKTIINSGVCDTEFLNIIIQLARVEERYLKEIRYTEGSDISINAFEDHECFKDEMLQTINRLRFAFIRFNGKAKRNNLPYAIPFLKKEDDVSVLIVGKEICEFLKGRYANAIEDIKKLADDFDEIIGNRT